MENKATKEMIYQTCCRNFARVQYPYETDMPAWVRERLDAFLAKLLQEIEKAYAETGQWFFCKGASRITDEQETYAVWNTALLFLPLEKLPHYTPENHQKAICFWQSWQNAQSGVMYNPRYQDPQNPENLHVPPDEQKKYAGLIGESKVATGVNGKYVSNILNDLGSAPLYPFDSTNTSMKSDYGYDLLWEYIEKGHSSPAGAMPINLLYYEDWEKYTHKVEAGIGALLRGYDPSDCIWRTPHPTVYEEYQPSAGFKIISRICGYCGMSNFPQEMLKNGIDSLINNRNALNHSVETTRNYVDMIFYYMTLTTYRREELFDLVRLCLDGLYSPKIWEHTGSTSYAIFAMFLIGTLLHWKEFDVNNVPDFILRLKQGYDLPVFLEADPYGNWCNLIPKQPGEEDLSMFERNVAAWSRKIIEITPAVLFTGISEDSMSFSLTEPLPEHPYLSASWAGTWEIYVNGVFMKRLEYDLPDRKAGLYISPECVAEQNTITVRCLGKGKQPITGAPETEKEPFLSLGIINWS